MKYYKSKRNMGLMAVTPFRDHEGGCCSDPINQPPKSKILNASSVASGHEITTSGSEMAYGHAVDRLSEKNVKYIEDLKKILCIVKQ